MGKKTLVTLLVLAGLVVLWAGPFIVSLTEKGSVYGYWWGFPASLTWAATLAGCFTQALYIAIFFKEKGK